MKPILDKFKALHAVPPSVSIVDAGLLLLRLLFCLSLALSHGRFTFSGFLNGATDYPDPLGLGASASMAMMGFAEFICALLVAVGLLTRVAAIPIVIGFLVAFFIFHSADPFGSKELAYLYGSAFVVILLVGPGKYSLDYMVFGKPKTV